MNGILKTSLIAILLTAILLFVLAEYLYPADYTKYDIATEPSFDQDAIKEEISRAKDIFDATNYMHNLCLDNRFKAAIYTAQQIKAKFGEKTESFYLYWGLLGWSYVMTGDIESAINSYKIYYRVNNYPRGVPKDKENSEDYRMDEWVNVINKLYDSTYYRKDLLAKIYDYSLEFKKTFPNAPAEYSKTPNEMIRIYEEKQNEKRDYEIKKVLVENFFNKLAEIIRNKDKAKLKVFLNENSINSETSDDYYNYFTEYFFEWDIKSLEFKVTDFDYSKETYNRFGYSSAIYEIKSEPDIDYKIRQKMNNLNGRWGLRFRFNDNKALLFH